jgi:hypothetical protein
MATAACGDSEGEPSPTATSPPSVTGAPSVSDLGTAAADVVVFGADAGDYLADRFSLTQGDFNGDGLDDLLIGAPLADGPDNARTNAGEAYVIFGSADIGGVIDLAAGLTDLTVIGAEGGDNLGFVVAAGDVNGDAIDDVLVGSRFATPGAGRVHAGEVYVIFGGPTISGTVDTSLDDSDFTIAGAEAGDFLGYALAAGDLNGDRVDDIITASPGAGGSEPDRLSSGQAYVVFGSSSLSGTVDVGADEQDFTILGADADDLLANYAASGDVNGDGLDDIFLGTHKADGPDNQRDDAGEAYVIFGDADLEGTLDLASGKAFLHVVGGDAMDWTGFVLTAADVNGDGVDDLIVGARNADGADNGRNNAGEVYLFFGSSDLPDTIDLAEDQPDVTLIGVDPGDILGHAVATGDVNGDDIADILAGAPASDSANNRRTDGGEVLVFYGSPSWPSIVDGALGQHNVVVFGPDAGDELGFSVASGDLNGDGLDDIIGGALLADGPDDAREDGGETHVILSKP